MIKSIIICKHGKFGYSASLRFEDNRNDKDISSTNKYNLYRTIEYTVENEKKHEN